MAKPEYTSQYQEDRDRLTQRIARGYWRGISIGDGWMPLVIELDRQISKINPDYEIHQVKEKFGGLRFYCSTDEDPRIQELINKAEDASYTLCEWCGEPGSPDTRYYWLLTLCDEHKEARAREKEREKV